MSLLLRLARTVRARFAGTAGLAAGRELPSNLAEHLERAAQADARGEHDVAEALCREVIATAPSSAAAWLNLGLALELQRRGDAALEALQRAVDLDPAWAAAHYNLGRLHHSQGNHEAARESLARAVELAPGHVDARILLANAQDASGDRAAAIQSLRSAIAIAPEHLAALEHAALLLYWTGDIDEALQLYRRAFEIDPQAIDSKLGVALTLTEIGSIDEALEIARGVVESNPSSHRARIVYLFNLLLSDAIEPSQVIAEHRRVGALYEAEAPARPRRGPRAADKAKRLRVGYLSGDLNAHACSLLLAHVFERHDRSAITPIAYSLSTTADAYTRRMRNSFELWRDAAALDDDNLAALIEADGIDILVDLAGYTSASRMGVIARRPAPVQASWVAYISTSGLSAMTHRLTDVILDPPGTGDSESVETLHRLPRSLWSYRPPAEAAIGFEQAEYAGPVRFGAFNRYAKMSPTTFDLWCRVLRAVPGSTLSMLTVPKGEAQSRLLARFESNGIDASRVRLLPRLGPAQYYAAYRHVDVCLDPTPYSGGVTTCDALWMGVPVVTLRGGTPVSRSSASILSTAGCSDWIADTEDDYVRIATSLAARGPLDSRARDAAREHFRASAIMDELGYTRDIEAAYREMWTSACAAGATIAGQLTEARR